MEMPQIRPGLVKHDEPMPRVLARFYNSAQGNSAIQQLIALGVPNDRLGVTSPDHLPSGQGMVLSVATPDETLLPKIEAICRSQGAQVLRQRRS